MAKTFETDQPCIVCLTEGSGLVTFHHIKTRAAYPHLERVSWNMIPVCAWCHVPGFHQKGLSYMAKTYHQVRWWLERNGWSYDKRMGKWLHEGINGVVDEIKKQRSTKKKTSKKVSPKRSKVESQKDA